MKPALKLQIPEPCHENWASMDPVEQGRFCLSCRKTVVDFTSMTDRQMLEYFSNYSGNTCGRFQSDQLNRSIAAGVQKPTAWWKYMLGLLMPALLISSRSAAQGKVKAEKVVCTPPNYTKQSIILGRIALPQSEKKPSVVKGTVMDLAGNAIPRATVSVKGTNKGTVTDNEGSFTLRHSIPMPLTLTINSTGFTTKEISLDKEYNPSLPIHLKLENGRMGGLIVSYVLPKQPMFHQFKQFVADSLRKQSFKLYPNPVTTGSLLKTTGKLKKGDYYIRVTDIHGRVMQEERIDVGSGQMNIQFTLNRNILAGHYTVLLLDNKKKQIGTQQLIVN